jgi:hypothetical protein
MWVLPARRRVALLSLAAHADAAGRCTVPAVDVLGRFWQEYGPWPAEAGPPPVDYDDSVESCVTALCAAGELELAGVDGADGYRLARLGEWESLIRQTMGRGGWAELRTGGWAFVGEPN